MTDKEPASEPAPKGKAKSGKRRMQFGMRFLLFAFTLAIFAMAGWRSLIQPYLEGDAVRVQLQRAGASYESRPGPALISWLIGEERSQVVTSVEFPEPRFASSDHDEPLFRSLGKLTGLESLAVPGRNVTDETLNAWADLTSLRHLDLSNTLVSQPRRWPSWPLEELNLTSTRLEEEEFAGLRQYEALKILFVNRTSFGDLAVLDLASLPNLNRIHPGSSRLTPDGWVTLASYPALDRSRDLYWYHNTALRAVSPLLQVKADGQPDLSIAALPPADDVFAAYQAAMQGVKKFDWRNSMISVRPRRSDYSFQGIDALYVLELEPRPDAKIVDLSSSYLDDQRLACVENFPNLEELDLTNSWITDDGLNELKHCPKLRELSLEDTRISDAGLTQLLVACPQLHFLNLAGTRVTHRGLAKLAQLRELQAIVLPVGAFRGEELLELRQLKQLSDLYVARPGKWDTHSRLAAPWEPADLRAIKTLETPGFLPALGSGVKYSQLNVGDAIDPAAVGDSQAYYESMTFTPKAYEMLPKELRKAIYEARASAW